MVKAHSCIEKLRGNENYRSAWGDYPRRPCVPDIMSTQGGSQTVANTPTTPASLKHAVVPVTVTDSNRDSTECFESVDSTVSTSSPIPTYQSNGLERKPPVCNDQSNGSDRPPNTLKQPPPNSCQQLWCSSATWIKWMPTFWITSCFKGGCLNLYFNFWIRNYCKIDTWHRQASARHTWYFVNS